MPTQLRHYTINKGALDAFAAEWRVTIKPLREQLGFEIPAAWLIRETNQFVWLLSYDGPEDWETLDRAYHASDARRQMNPDPGRHIARAEHYLIEAIEKD